MHIIQRLLSTATMAETSSDSQNSTPSRGRWKFSPDQKIAEVLAPTVRNHRGVSKEACISRILDQNFPMFLQDTAHIWKTRVVRDGKYDPVHFGSGDFK